jgi:hypothetical protein
MKNRHPLVTNVLISIGVMLIVVLGLFFLAQYIAALNR